MNLKEYYEECDLVLPVNARFRILKFLLLDGVWLTFKRNTWSVDMLRKKLVEHCPVSFYWSVSYWLSPRGVERPSYGLSDRLLLGSDVFFDIDCDDGMSLQDAADEGKRLIKFMRGKGYKVDKIFFSGKKGFHIFFTSLEREGLICSNAVFSSLSTFILFKELKKQLVFDAFLSGIKIDYGVCLDIFRISRGEGSPHKDTGLVCTRLEEKDLNNIHAYFTSITSVSFSGARHPGEGVDDELLSGTKFLCNNEICQRSPLYSHAINNATNVEGLLRSSVRSPSFLFYKFLSNKVGGVKDGFFVHIVLHGCSLKKAIRVADEVCKVYNIPSLFVFESTSNVVGRDGGFMLVSPKVVCARRLIKILGFCNASNLGSFKRFGNSWVRSTAIVSEGRDVVVSEFVLVTRIVNLNVNGLGQFYSRECLSFLDFACRDRVVVDGVNLLGSEDCGNFLAKVKVNG